MRNYDNKPFRKMVCIKVVNLTLQFSFCFGKEKSWEFICLLVLVQNQANLHEPGKTYGANYMPILKTNFKMLFWLFKKYEILHISQCIEILGVFGCTYNTHMRREHVVAAEAVAGAFSPLTFYYRCSRCDCSRTPPLCTHLQKLG